MKELEKLGFFKSAAFVSQRCLGANAPKEEGNGRKYAKNTRLYTKSGTAV